MEKEQDQSRILFVQVEPCPLPEWLDKKVSAKFAKNRPASAIDEILNGLAVRGFVAAKTIPDADRAGVVRDFPGRGPAISNLPPRNEIFTDRVKVLERIRRELLAEPNAGELQTCAVYGLGGVGKTEAVTEFAHRFGSHYGLVWWIRAERQVSISKDLADLARELEIDQTAGQSRILTLLWKELQRRDRWLLIFDNAPDPAALEEFWPPSGSGDVLVTSRHTAWAHLVVTLCASDLSQQRPR